MPSLTIEVLEQLRVKHNGVLESWAPGQRFELTEDKARRLIEQVGDKVRIVDTPGAPSRDLSTITTQYTEPPTAPLQVGWLIVFRERGGRLRGGGDEREYGTVTGCSWNGQTWVVTVLNGMTVALSCITSVAKTNSEGQVVAAWAVKQHGYDGAGGS